MMKPIGIQRKRTKGWRMPPNTVYIGRPTMWGNPFNTTLEYEDWLTWYGVRGFDKKRDKILESLYKLKGKNLACWCPLNKNCHRNILLKLANRY